MDSGLLIEGRYRLREQLGHGGMSVVWRATDDVLGREVAVKVLAPQLATDPSLLRRLRAEARAAAGLRHTNVVAVYDYGETTDGAHTLPFVVMELVDGRTLAELLTGGPLPWRLAVLVCSQVAAALAAAHVHGIVHRDVKPGNVMVSAGGVKLVDFGISAAVGEMEANDGQVLGTPAYLAPERIDGGPVRPATDVYALGLLLYMTLAGRLPWDASTSTQMLKAHYYTDPDPLPPVPGLPADVVKTMRRCLAKRPAQRPTAAEVTDVLGEIAGLPPAELLRSVTTDHDPAPPVTEGIPWLPGSWVTSTGVPLHRSPAGRRSLVAATAAVALTVAGLVAWTADRPGATPAAAAAEPAAQPGCTVRYALRSMTAGRASIAVTLRNIGPAAVPHWQLTFTLPGGQRLVRGWTAGWRQDGSAVRAGGGTLPAGGSVATGFDATYREATAVPAAFRLNGVECRAEMSVQSPTTPPPARPPARQAPASASATHSVKAAKSGKGKRENAKPQRGGNSGKGGRHH